MEHYYFITIGGVGSRLMEAFVRLCESGYITTANPAQTNKITCLMIDADANCGNTLRTEQLIKDYIECRKHCYTEGGTIFKAELAGVLNGKTEVFRTTPAGEQALTVEDNLVGNNNREAYNFMKSAYSETEYKMNVNKGFYGKPTVGSLVFAMRTVKDGADAIKALVTDINSKPSEDIVRVFLGASLFGGTGAAGLPTIAKQIESSAVNRNNLHMMACLMLPYFQTDTQDNPMKEINHEDFASKAQNALSFYRAQMDGVFDSVFMIGDPQKPVRGKHYEEGTKQLNMPHPFELFAAAQARKFFRSKHTEGAYKETRWYADPPELYGETLRELQWRDLRSDGTELQRYLESFILFNYYFSMYATPSMYNYQGASGEYFRSRTYGLDDELHNAKWLLGSFAHAKKKGMLWWKKIVFNGWGVNLPTQQFDELYQYLTNSARWYFGLLYEYSRTSETCWECGHRTCSRNFPNELINCVSAQVLLPDLFGATGAQMIARRACFPHWLKKAQGGGTHFLGKSDDFAKDAHANALIGDRENPFNVREGLRHMIIGQHADKTILFTRLVNRIYSIVARLRVVN